jgi:hydrogenase expression/formation protein HypE
MMGFSAEQRILRTGGVSPGQLIVQAGPAPIEAAAVLASASDPRLTAIDPDTLAAARAAVATPGISVVDAALLAAEVGATALHDPTEGGLSAGLYELAEASDVQIQLDEQSVLWFEPGRTVCRALGADPWGALASGALLASLPADRASEAHRRFESRGIPMKAIGRAVSGRGVVLSDGSPLPTFARDEIARVLGEAAPALPDRSPG